MKYPIFLTLLGWLTLTLSCNQPFSAPEKSPDLRPDKTIRKKRADGTLSSVNQVDEEGRVHGLRVTYFEDGKTVYSKFNFSHGQKQGPSIRYYRNGQIFEHTEFELGKKHGLSRKYHKDGTLLSECHYEEGHALPGLKEYREDGTLITTYPEVRIREMDHLKFRNRIDLELSCASPVNGVKYYRLLDEADKTSRIYLISEKNAASLQFYVQAGTTLKQDIALLAEIPTEYGNMFVRKLNYKLVASNKK
jgi:hypothetical protein